MPLEYWWEIWKAEVRYLLRAWQCVWWLRCSMRKLFCGKVEKLLIHTLLLEIIVPVPLVMQRNCWLYLLPLFCCCCYLMMVIIVVVVESRVFIVDCDCCYCSVIVFIPLLVYYDGRRWCAIICSTGHYRWVFYDVGDSCCWAVTVPLSLLFWYHSLLSVFCATLPRKLLFLIVWKGVPFVTLFVVPLLMHSAGEYVAIGADLGDSRCLTVEELVMWVPVDTLFRYWRRLMLEGGRCCCYDREGVQMSSFMVWLVVLCSSVYYCCSVVLLLQLFWFQKCDVVPRREEEMYCCSLVIVLVCLLLLPLLLYWWWLDAGKIVSVIGIWNCLVMIVIDWKKWCYCFIIQRSLLQKWWCWYCLL